jgi:hypothetical protein
VEKYLSKTIYNQKGAVHERKEDRVSRKIVRTSQYEYIKYP